MLADLTPFIHLPLAALAHPHLLLHLLPFFMTAITTNYKHLRTTMSCKLISLSHPSFVTVILSSTVPLLPVLQISRCWCHRSVLFQPPFYIYFARARCFIAVIVNFSLYVSSTAYGVKVLNIDLKLIIPIIPVILTSESFRIPSWNTTIFGDHLPKSAKVLFSICSETKAL